jgi:hypothetical protein
MPELPKVSQDFTADATAYSDAIDEMITKNEELVTSIRNVQDAIDEMHGKTIDIGFDEDEIMEQLAYINEIIDDATRDRTVTILVKYVTEGNPEDVQAATELIKQEVIPANNDNALGVTSDYMQDLVDEATKLNDVMNETGTLGDEGAAALERLADEYDLAGSAASRLAAQERSLAAAFIEDKINSGDLAESADGVASKMGLAGEAADDLAAGYERLHNNTVFTADDMNVLNDALARTVVDAEGVTRYIEPAATATKALGQAAADSIPTWFSWTRQFQTFGGAAEMALGKMVPLVTSIAAWHLVLDSVAEGIIALSGSLIALSAAAVGLAPSFLDIYNHLTATRDQIEAFGIEIAPFNQWFLNLQHAMQTQAIELYGEALLDMGKAGSSTATAIENAGGAIDRMGAKISEWVGSNTDFAQTISKGADYAKDLGDILGNLIVIIDELIRADSGVVNIVLTFARVFTGAIVAVLGFSETLDKVLLIGHAFLLWGGLLSSFLINLALVFLKPVAGILSFIAGTKSATVAIGEFEAAQSALAGEEIAANPLQKMGIVLQSLVVSLKGMGTAIATWAAEVGTSMAEAEGVVATGAAGIEGIIAVLDIVPGIVWIAAIAAGIGYLAYQTTQASASTAAFISKLNESLGQMNISQQATQGMTDAVGQLDAKIASTNVSSELQNWGGSWQHFGDDARGVITDMVSGIASLSSGNVIGGLEKVGDAVKGIFVPGAGAAQQAKTDISAYEQAISGLTSSQATLFKVAGATMQQNGMTFTQALGLMDAAGIKSGESFQEDMTQVNGLITGYKNLGVQGGLLGNSINAITLQTEDQESEISKITSAWTNFISLVTGGQSAFDTFGQQMFSVAQALGATSTTLETESGKASVKVETTATSMSSLASAVKDSKTSFNGLSSASLNLQQTFLSGVSDASNQINSLLELSSAAGAGKQGLAEVSQAGKDMVAEMLPVAQGSAAATTDLYALAQQAGYTGNDSFKALATWVGNTQNPMANLEGITNKMTIAAGNLATDVQNLANAIDTDLNSAMALAVLSGNKTQTAFNNAATAIKNAHGNMTSIVPSVETLGKSIYQDLGGNIQQTNAELSTFMKAMGLSPGQIKAILSQIDSSFATTASNVNHSLETIQQEINSLHGKTITITSQYVTSGGTVPGVTEGIPSGVKAAGGMLVPGSGSGDTVPAMLSPGEAVVPKHLVSAIAPFLGANKVPGFASGGMVAPMTAPLPDPTGLLALQTQMAGTTSNAAAYLATEKLDQTAVTKAQAVLAAAKTALGYDESHAKALDAKTAAAKLIDSKAAAVLKEAESAESKAKSNLSAAEKMKKDKDQQDAVKALTKVYDAAASKVTKDKTALAAAAKLLSTDEHALSSAKTAESQDAFSLWQKQDALTAITASAVQAQLRTTDATKQLDALQAIQSGSKGVSSMNSLLLPGTPLSTLASAMPGLGLYWGSYDSGGYLPPGLSLAVNGTGAPEPVGAAANPGELHSHISVNLDGQQIWQAVQKQGLKYGLRNNGLATGLMKPK